jgi:type IV secretion system protein VirB11
VFIKAIYIIFCYLAMTNMYLSEKMGVYFEADIIKTIENNNNKGCTSMSEQERDLFILTPREKEGIWPLMKHLEPEAIKGVKEIVINKPGQLVLEMFDGTWVYKEDKELNLQKLMDITRFICEKNKVKFDFANPIISCKMPGGHRTQIVAGTQNSMKYSMAIRLKNEREFSIDDFKIPEADKQAIRDAVSGAKTILISGGTGSGKTSFMNAVMKYIPDDDRLITLEDVRELKVEQPNWVAFIFSEDKEGNNNVNELLNACLRMRPDRIILGEIRKENAFTFCSAINTGHAGSMGTIHANDPKSALDAVINRVMLNGDTTESAIAVLRRQLINDIYGVVQLNRTKEGIVGYFQVLRQEDADRRQAPATQQQAQQPTQPAAQPQQPQSQQTHVKTQQPQQQQQSQEQPQREVRIPQKEVG